MVQGNTEAAAPVVTAAGRTVTGPQRVPSTQQLQEDDRKMMYPWSIGTTRVAKNAVGRREECPPEVYIG